MLTTGTPPCTGNIQFGSLRDCQQLYEGGPITLMKDSTNISYEISFYPIAHQIIPTSCTTDALYVAELRKPHEEYIKAINRVLDSLALRAPVRGTEPQIDNYLLSTDNTFFLVDINDLLAARQLCEYPMPGGGFFRAVFDLNASPENFKPRGVAAYHSGRQRDYNERVKEMTEDGRGDPNSMLPNTLPDNYADTNSYEVLPPPPEKLVPHAITTANSNGNKKRAGALPTPTFSLPQKRATRARCTSLWSARRISQTGSSNIRTRLQTDRPNSQRDLYKRKLFEVMAKMEEIRQRMQLDVHRGEDQENQQAGQAASQQAARPQTKTAVHSTANDRSSTQLREADCAPGVRPARSEAESQQQISHEQVAIHSTIQPKLLYRGVQATPDMIRYNNIDETGSPTRSGDPFLQSLTSVTPSSALLSSTGGGKRITPYTAFAPSTGSGDRSSGITPRVNQVDLSADQHSSNEHDGNEGQGSESQDNHRQKKAKVQSCDLKVDESQSDTEEDESENAMDEDVRTVAILFCR